MIDKIVANINNALYTYVLIIMLILCGLYFTVRTGFAQFRLFGEQVRSVTEKPADAKGVSSFQALMVSTASRVGTGNMCFNCNLPWRIRLCILDVGNCNYWRCIRSY